MLINRNLILKNIFYNVYTFNPKFNTIFYHHFFELKLRFKYLVFSLLITFLTCYHYCFEIIYIFTKPFLYHIKYFIFTDLTEAFYTSIEISFFFSFYVIIPLFLYHFWCFFVPSRFKNERKKLNFIIFVIFIFLVLSIIIVYLILLPLLYQFLVNFQLNTNLLNIQLEARIQPYVKLVCEIFVFFTFFFQLPLIFLWLIKLKCIKINILVKNRIKIFFMILIFASLFSPPDVFSQFSITLFLIFSLEALFILGFFYKKQLALMKNKKIFSKVEKFSTSEKKFFFHKKKLKNKITKKF